MDWTLAIEKNREALRRILAMLIAMVGAPNGGGTGAQFTFFPQVDAPSQNPALTEKSKLSPAPTLVPTLPRHLHRFVLRLLRPAEAAARRLIILAARGLVVELSPPRPRTAKPKPLLNRRNGFGTGVVIRPGPLPEWARALAPKRSSTFSLPLFDPIKRFGGRPYVKHRDVPRIRSFDDPRIGFFQPPRAPDPLPQSPDDPLDAGRLHRRLEAMASALDDLPRQAKRLARWQARLDARLAREGGGAAQSDTNSRVGVSARSGCFQRLSPMRPGRPPGWRRRPAHAVDEVLNELHGLALWVRERADSS